MRDDVSELARGEVRFSVYSFAEVFMLDFVQEDMSRLIPGEGVG